MIGAADRELVDCAHRFVESMIPMPARVVDELRERGWTASPLIFMLHDGRRVPKGSYKNNSAGFHSAYAEHRLFGSDTSTDLFFYSP